MREHCKVWSRDISTYVLGGSGRLASIILMEKMLKSLDMTLSLSRILLSLFSMWTDREGHVTIIMGTW